MSHTNGWLTVNYIGSHNILLLSYYCNVRLLYSISYDERYLLEFRTPEGWKCSLCSFVFLIELISVPYV